MTYYDQTINTTMLLIVTQSPTQRLFAIAQTFSQVQYLRSGISYMIRAMGPAP